MHFFPYIKLDSCNAGWRYSMFATVMLEFFSDLDWQVRNCTHSYGKLMKDILVPEIGISATEKAIW